MSGSKPTATAGDGQVEGPTIECSATGTGPERTAGRVPSSHAADLGSITDAAHMQEQPQAQQVCPLKHYTKSPMFFP